MTAEAFNPEAGCVVLHEYKADKTGKPRVVFLPPEIVSLLREQHNATRVVRFCGPRRVNRGRVGALPRACKT